MDLSAYPDPQGGSRLVDSYSQMRAATHPRCVACSSANAVGLHLEYKRSADGDVEAWFDCDPKYTGFPGVLHGGVVALLLDSAMTNCLFAHGLCAFTADLKVRFHAPVHTGRPARIRAHMVGRAKRRLELEAVIEQDGEPRAEARAKFLESPVG